MRTIKEVMIDFAVNHPKTIVAVLVLVTLAAGAFLPQVTLDTDPENMLERTEPVRVFHNQAKKNFDLSDVVVVGVINEGHPDGVFTPTTLGHVYELTEFAKGLRWEDPDDPGRFEGVIEADIIAPSVVDHMSQAGPGTIRFQWLMPEPPKTREEALVIRDRILSNPMLTGMLGSEDGRAVCLYLPLTDKLLSYKVFTALNEKIESFGNTETYHITGLPVAEGAVGVEMFTEMKVASPLSMLVILGLLLVFFRKWVLITLPMIIATVSIIISMGLMIGMGFEVHILSSMLPIFLMSISIVDCVHVLSEFFDVYTREKGRKDSITEVMHTLFVPMLYTSLTTAAGFLSLTLTSLPPARVFGLFLSFGVMLAWLCTIMLVPAYVMCIPEDKLRNFGLAAQEKERENWLTRGLRRLGAFTRNRPGRVMAGLCFAIALAVVGISQTRINDNYSKRFAMSHPIRQADIALNRHFGGTYTAYLVLKPDQNPTASTNRLRQIRDDFLAFAADFGQLPVRPSGLFPEIGSKPLRPDRFLASVIDEMDAQANRAADAEYDTWQALADYLRLEKEKLKPFKQPEVLSYMAGLQQHLETTGLVGKATSVADIIQKVNQELIDGRPENHRIPDSIQKVAECYMQFQQSHRPGDLWHRVTPDFDEANIMLQMPSGNSMDMEAVVKAVDAYMAVHPAPARLKHDWAGLHYVNLVFQNTMFWEMLRAFLQSFLVVLVMMALLFRSVKWGLLCMVPLSITIAGIYGAVGIMGKDYDMAVAVLSVLSIGIAVDFAIHFLERSRHVRQKAGSWQETSAIMFGEPARAISRNVMVVAIGFLPLILAKLVPYKITGLMLFAILLFSGVITLLALPVVLGVWETAFFPGKNTSTPEREDDTHHLEMAKEQAIK